MQPHNVACRLLLILSYVLMARIIGNITVSGCKEYEDQEEYRSLNFALVKYKEVDTHLEALLVHFANMAVNCFDDPVLKVHIVTHIPLLHELH